MERDIQLDCYRSLAMIYIVCVIHIMYLLQIGEEPVKSVLLFEMPVIFFIAGASQSYKKEHSFKDTLINRARRVLVPYYIFLAVLFVWFSACTLLHATFHGREIDMTALTTAEITKMLMTGGCVDIPFLGYTWFILCYFLISCSLPLQKKLIDKMPAWLYMLSISGIYILWSLLGMHSPENIVEECLCYNLFYILGFLYYRKAGCKKIALAAVVPVIISVYLLASGKLVPMQSHKFPPDLLFTVYCLACLCILALIFGKVKIRYSRLLKIWNVRGYSIYLYQSISFFIVDKLTENITRGIKDNLVLYFIYILPVFVTATALSYFTYRIECKINSLIKV